MTGGLSLFRLVARLERPFSIDCDSLTGILYDASKSNFFLTWRASAALKLEVDARIALESFFSLAAREAKLSAAAKESARRRAATAGRANRHHEKGFRPRAAWRKTSEPA